MLDACTQCQYSSGMGTERPTIRELWNDAANVRRSMEDIGIIRGHTSMTLRVMAICDGFLHSIRPDDDEPLTADILRMSGWTWNSAVQVWWLRVGEWIIELAESWEMKQDGWQCAYGPADGGYGGCPLPNRKTRRDLRVLLEVFRGND